MKNVDSLYSESTQLRSSDEYDSSIKSPEDRKTLNMEDIHAKSALTSSMFSAMFGQQNNDLVRTLRLREKNIVADVLGKAIKSQFCFYKNLSPEKLSEIKENGFVRIKNASSTINASEI